jgi:hypothetical protein
VLQDVLRRARRLGQLGRDAADQARLLAEVLDVVAALAAAAAGAAALVGELREARLVAGKLLIQVKEVQRRRRQLSHTGRKHGGLQRRQRRLKLRRDERQRLVLHAHVAVQLQHIGNAPHVQRKKGVVEEGREVAGQRFRLLQARAQALREGGHVWHVHVISDVSLCRAAVSDARSAARARPTAAAHAALA